MVPTRLGRPDIPVLDRVLLGAFVDQVRSEGLVHQVGPFHIRPDVETSDAGDFLGYPRALVGHVGRLAVSLDFEELHFIVQSPLGLVQLGLQGFALRGDLGGGLALGLALFAEHGLEFALDRVDTLLGLVPGPVSFDNFAGDDVGLAVAGGFSVGGSGNDERRAGLVYEDAVNFVNNREIQGALNLAIDRSFHVVAEVIEAELAVGPVGDVTGVVVFSLGGLHADSDVPYRDTKEFEYGFGEIGADPDKVVIGRDQVSVHAFQSGHIYRRIARYGLSLAGGLFGNRTFVKHHARNELHVELVMVLRPPRRFSHQCEDLRFDLLARLALSKSAAQLCAASEQLLVRKGAHLRLERVDLRDDELQPRTDQALVARAANKLQKRFT